MPPSHSGASAPPAGAAETPTGQLDTRRKRALFRAWHRGTREMDLVMGRFAESELPDLSEAELGLFERLLDLPEPDVFAWVTGRTAPPADIDRNFIARLGVFRGA